MVFCRICKSSGKQGDIFWIDDFGNYDSAICANCIQPERTNPEDYIEKKLDMICDVPNSGNK